MKGKGALWLWIAVLVVFLAGSGFVGYKLWKRQKDRAEQQRWEVNNVMTLNSEPTEEELAKYLESENEKLDRYEVLRPVIDELDLITFWGVAGVDEAMVKLKACAKIRPGDLPNEVIFVVSDKDKEMTGKLAEAISRSYKAMQLRDSLRLPPPPPGFQE